MSGRVQLMACGLAIAVAAITLTGVSGQALADEYTCHGLTATMVGSVGSTIHGTDDADVIVTNGASEVHAEAGADTICTTNVAGPGVDEWADVSAGPGDDLVDTTGNEGVRSFVYLDEGDDVFLGGDEEDIVKSAGWEGDPDQAEGADRVTTGAGRDWVTTGGTLAAPDGDTIDLGPGADELELRGAIGLDASWTGGTEDDQITIEVLRGSATWVWDNNAGEVTRNGLHAGTMSSFERFNFWSGRASHYSFVGGPEREVVRAMVALDDVSLGGGNDRVQLWNDELIDDSALDMHGGSGVDTLKIGFGYNDGYADLNLAQGQLRLVKPKMSGATSTLDGFERAQVYAYWAHVIGSSADERIQWDACHGNVAGRRGDDTLRFVPSEENSCGYYNEDADITINGGRGDDRLTGGDFPDRLYGGPGDDYANGRTNRDLCRVETSLRCEIP